MRVLFGVLALVAAVTASSNPLQQTEFLKTSLNDLVTKGKSLQQCITKVTHPLTEAAQFAVDINHVMNIIHRLEGRVEVVVDAIEIVMLIPYVGAFASPVLGPTTAVMRTIDSGLKKVIGEVDHIVQIITKWLNPIRFVQGMISGAMQKMTQMINFVQKVNDETNRMEICVEALPTEIKASAEGALEAASGFIGMLPKGAVKVVGAVDGGCQKVEGFLHKIHLARRKRTLPFMGKVISVLEHIEGALGPVGHFMDKVHDALNKRVCLIQDLITIGGKVVKKVEQVGQQIAKGAEHVGQEIVHTAQKAGNEIAKLPGEIKTGAEQLGQQIVHTATNVGNQIANTATNVGNKIVSGAKDLGNTIANTANTAVHKVSSFFHHLFGRRSAIDGKYYIIVDADSYLHKRHADLCFSVHDVLNFVHGVTHGMLGEAQKFIGSLFKGRSPIHVPALTPEVTGMKRVLQGVNVPMPDVRSVMKLGGGAMDSFLKAKPAQDFLKAVPVCKAALNGIGIKVKK